MKDKIRFFYNRIKWIIKQLFPLRYWSYYGCGGIQYVTTWKMWFGVVYKQRRFIVKREVDVN